MMELDSLGHNNLVVDDIEEATEFYVKLFNPIPIQDFPRLRKVDISEICAAIQTDSGRCEN